LCGLESAVLEGSEEKTRQAISLDVTLHAFMFMLSGIPVIYSGDEIGQLNDYSYENDPKKAVDSRYLHRGPFAWDKAELRKDPESVQGQIYDALDHLEKIRRSEKTFVIDADVWTMETGEPELLAIGRYLDGEKMIGIFNFSERDKTFWYEEEGVFTDMITGEKQFLQNPLISAYGFRWLKRVF